MKKILTSILLATAALTSYAQFSTEHCPSRKMSVQYEHDRFKNTHTWTSEKISIRGGEMAFIWTAVSGQPDKLRFVAITTTSGSNTAWYKTAITTTGAKFELDPATPQVTKWGITEYATFELPKTEIAAIGNGNYAVKLYGRNDNWEITIPQFVMAQLMCAVIPDRQQRVR